MKHSKALKIAVASVAAVGLIGSAAALAACSSGASSSVKSYSMTIDSWSEYTEEHELPFLTGQSGALFGFDSWIVSGTKVNFDDEGNPVDCYWTFSLDIDETPATEQYGIVEYCMTMYFHGSSTEIYANPIDAFYKFYGYGYELEGGYHLYVANFAESTITLNCAVETPGWPENGDTGEGEGTFVKLDGPNGMIYYHYCNSDIQAAGGNYGFPYMSNLTQGFSECDVLVSGSDITGFDNITNAVAVLVEASSGSDVGGDIEGGEGEEGGEEEADAYIYENDTWSASATVDTAKAGTYTYTETVPGMMADEEFNWSVEWTLAVDGKATAHATCEAVVYGPSDITFTGTWKTYANGDETLIIISNLGVIAGDDGTVPMDKEVGAAPTVYSFVFTNDSGNTVLKIGTDNVLSLLAIQ